jgi:hypothetical protein
MTPKIPMQDDEIKIHKPVSADFVSFRAGIRCAERVYGVAELIAKRDEYAAAADKMAAAHKVERDGLRAALAGVIRVADRKTDEFDAAREALKGWVEP